MIASAHRPAARPSARCVTADISIGDANGVGFRALGRELRKLEGGAALMHSPPMRLIGRVFYMSIASDHVPPFLGNL